MPYLPRSKWLFSAILLFWPLKSFAAPQNTDCRLNEVTYFFCHTQEDEHIGLCGDADGHITFYTGNNDANAKIQSDENTPFSFVHFAHYQYDSNEVVFSKNGTDFKIFDTKDKDSQSYGLTMTTKGKDQTKICTKDIFSQMYKLRDILPNSKDNATNMAPIK